MMWRRGSLQFGGIQIICASKCGWENHWQLHSRRHPQAQSDIGSEKRSQHIGTSKVCSCSRDVQEGAYRKGMQHDEPRFNRSLGSEIQPIIKRLMLLTRTSKRTTTVLSQ